MTAERHTQAMTRGAAAWERFARLRIVDTDAMPDCDNCDREIPEDDAAPSCGSHNLHIGCHAWFQCRHCADAMRDIDAERDGAWLA
jgi:Zn finger protein HypA/HybF involved in hydrogenase expression